MNDVNDLIVDVKLTIGLVEARSRVIKDPSSEA